MTYMVFCIGDAEGWHNASDREELTAFQEGPEAFEHLSGYRQAKTCYTISGAGTKQAQPGIYPPGLTGSFQRQVVPSKRKRCWHVRLYQ